ncbi:LVIVD repeat-containing protein [Christiangramia sabulilitoris]|uniref:LVIVD repeat-containing protein n=1 Tax=Christiangramia sabulilitoris TaxID=2583991 RepID=A0A550I0F1_9FLAO|nr:hypothetical protein [Christiangramia sabulilitoris]TRO64425.1 hypothetical protein FGM01_13115 [Christiangramia sabulilitoris]
MKKLFLFPLLLAFLFLSSCSEEQESNLVTVAVPVTQSIADFRASVKVEQPKGIKESGKIYAWKDYIFVNDKNEGVHILDNQDPRNPVKIKFINIPGNKDIAISDAKLYADSGMDLVVFDISDMNNIKETNRLKDVFPTYFHIAPAGASYVDFENFNQENEVIVGYVFETRKIEMVTMDTDWLSFESVSGGNRSGTGGSMSRFSINKDFLYLADETALSVFDISNPSDPNRVSSEYAGWRIETIFNYEDHLYLGSATGMYIYSIEDAAAPKQVSFLQHVLGCDPVVVKDNYAYVTIRGGNECEQNFNQLDVVDISDKQNPEIVETYEMTNPYGLGVKDDWLFVCDGNDGLKVFDIKNTPSLEQIGHFSDINTYDVIPLDEKLLMVGNNTLYQYSYKGDEINLLSTYILN